LSSAKGLAFGAELNVVAVSRLEVLAQLAGTEAAALDAHRHEVFLRVGGREMLAGVEELAGMVSEDVAVCDEAAGELLTAAWPEVRLVRVEAPSAADALRVAEERVRAGIFDDVEALDGHYLRRSDAEIFGEKQEKQGLRDGNGKGLGT